MKEEAKQEYRQNANIVQYIEPVDGYTGHFLPMTQNSRLSMGKIFDLEMHKRKRVFYCRRLDQVLENGGENGESTMTTG